MTSELTLRSTAETLQVRPTEARSKAGGPASSEATKEQVEAEVNKAKVATKRHQRYKMQQKAKTHDQEKVRLRLIDVQSLDTK